MEAADLTGTIVSPECMACGETVPHVDTVNGWCDGCHSDYEYAQRMLDDMADKLDNGATFIEA